MDKTSSKFTGYGYDVANLVKNMNIIQRILGCKIDEYGIDKEVPRLINVTAPNWEIVAIGIKTEPCDIHMPCLMRNVETGDWAWARDLIYFADKDGFCWSHGHYSSEDGARDGFSKAIDGLVWYAWGY